MAVVTVEGAGVAVVGHEGGESAEICAKVLRSNGGIFPAFMAVWLAGDGDSCAEARLADVPDAGGIFGVVGAGAR